MVKYKTYLVDQYLAENCMTKKEFCKRCGISMHTLQRFMSNDSSINYVTAIAISSQIGVALPDFVENKCKVKKLSQGIVKSTSLF